MHLVRTTKYMPLANFLSAVRELILDTDTFADNLDDRVADYTTRFPALSPEEIQDLAKITPDRLKIYTSTIFHGEKSTLLNHFACSFACLAKYWEEAYRRKFSEVGLVRALHRRYPWETNQTITLANNYVRYVAEALTEIQNVCPWIVDLTNLELLSLITKREHSDVEARDSLQEDELLQLTVEEILSLKAQIPEYVHFEQFSYDVIEVIRSFHQKSSIDTVPTTKNPVSAICGRNQKLYPRWAKTDIRLHDWLRDRRQKAQIDIEELADFFLNSIADPADSEEEVFILFLRTLTSFINAGILVISRT